MEIVEGELAEMHIGGQCLMEQIIDLSNLRKAYKQVVRNKGKGGADGMDVNDLFTWCQSHIEDLRQSLMDGTFVPNPVRRVESRNSVARVTVSDPDEERTTHCAKRGRT